MWRALRIEGTFVIKDADRLLNAMQYQSVIIHPTRNAIACWAIIASEPPPWCPVVNIFKTTTAPLICRPANRTRLILVYLRRFKDRTLNPFSGKSVTIENAQTANRNNRPKTLLTSTILISSWLDKEQARQVGRNGRKFSCRISYSILANLLQLRWSVPITSRVSSGPKIVQVSSIIFSLF